MFERLACLCDVSAGTGLVDEAAYTGGSYSYNPYYLGHVKLNKLVFAWVISSLLLSTTRMSGHYQDIYVSVPELLIKFKMLLLWI